MASGTFERPLPDPEIERSLLGLGGFGGVMRFEVPNNSTRYLVFASGYKAGLLATGGYGGSHDDKSGLYTLDSGSSAIISLPPIKAVTRTGLTITPLNNTVIQIVNPSGYLWGVLLMSFGTTPTLETTNPTA